MNTAKHTPGPWHVSTTHIGEIAVADSRGINLCVLGDASLFDTITQDAAIIAAAPAMYEALSMAQATVERLQRHAPGSALGTLDVIQKALAQAEGK